MTDVWEGGKIWGEERGRKERREETEAKRKKRLKWSGGAEETEGQRVGCVLNAEPLSIEQTWIAKSRPLNET
jgi:hypothetical protein